MIGRLLGGAAGLLLYLLAATMITAILVAGYVWSAWELDGTKVAKALAVLQGAEQARPGSQPEAEKPKPAEEQPSYEEILQRRSLAARDLELREQALESAVDELKMQARKLAEERRAQGSRETQFATAIKTLKEGAQAEGREVVLRTLASIKPAQAKQQIFEMLDREETDEVVLLLSALTESKRAKIVAEFKTPDENKKLAEVLRRIREGEPQVSLADKAAEMPSEEPPAGSGGNP